MEQGMWVSPLQMAEDTTCLGWLLYSADEYNQEELQKEIWSFVGVNVALRFREIDDGVPCKEGITRTLRPKALHIEIDKGDSARCHHALEKLYSSAATTFPLGIKMRLVQDHKLLTNTKAKAKADSLQANQHRFLLNMETCITWELLTLDLVDSTTGANLRQFIMNIPDPERPGEQLFHAINKMLRHNGYISISIPTKAKVPKKLWQDSLCIYKACGHQRSNRQNLISSLQVRQLKEQLTPGGIPRKDV